MDTSESSLREPPREIREVQSCIRWTFPEISLLARLKPEGVTLTAFIRACALEDPERTARRLTDEIIAAAAASSDDADRNP